MGGWVCVVGSGGPPPSHWLGWGVLSSPFSQSHSQLRHVQNGSQELGRTTLADRKSLQHASIPTDFDETGTDRKLSMWPTSWGGSETYRGPFEAS